MVKGLIRLRASAKNSPKVAEYLAAAKRGAKNQHVVPHDGQWAVRSTTSNRITRIFPNQKAAIGNARQIAISRQAELFIHGRDGRIRERNSYGRDPFPPRG